jgi:hypothetical protein
MTEIHARVVTTALLSKGFIKIEASHHTMFWLVAAGRRRSIRTRLSHGQGKVDDWLLGEIAKQLHLSKPELLRFIQCEIGYEQYVNLMIERGHLRPLAGPAPSAGTVEASSDPHSTRGAGHSRRSRRIPPGG